MIALACANDWLVGQPKLTDVHESCEDVKLEVSVTVVTGEKPSVHSAPSEYDQIYKLLTECTGCGQ
jgi:hypothetical protein